MFDKLGNRIAEKMGENISRRSMVSKLGKTIFAMFGVAFFASLPVHHEAQKAKASRKLDADGALLPDANCYDSKYCGIDGFDCYDCGSTTTGVCPSGTYTASSWTACCGSGTVTEARWRYTDCCSSNSSKVCLSGNWCSNNPNTQSWCSTTYKYYYCTLVQRTSSSC